MDDMIWLRIALPLFLSVPPARLQQTWSALEETCSRLHSCDRNPSFQTCFCDETCHAFGDCCPSIISKKGGSFGARIPRAHCLENGATVVASCGKDWSGDHLLADKCHGLGSREDPLSMVPASSSRTGISYRNFYCAVCSGVDPAELVIWDIGLDDPATLVQVNLESNLWERPTYRDSLWSVFNRSRQSHFHPLSLSFIYPSNVKIRPCQHGLIDSCPIDWTSPNVKEKCHQYLSPVYSKKARYKNAHCALCNGEGLDDILCYNNDTLRIGLKNMPKIHFRARLETTEKGNYSISICCPKLLPRTTDQLNKTQLSNSLKTVRERSSRDSRQDESPKPSRYSAVFRGCVKIPFYPGQYQKHENFEVEISEYNVTFNQSLYYEHADGSIYVCASQLGDDALQSVESRNFSPAFRNCQKFYFDIGTYEILANDSAHISNFNLTFDEYLVINNKLLICDFPKDANEEKEEDTLDYHEHFLACPKFIIEKENYKIMNGSMVHIAKYGLYYNKSWYYINETTKSLLICIPPHISSGDAFEDVFSNGYQAVISVVCVCISIICLVLHLAAFFLVAEMRNLAGMNLASLCVALLFSYILFLCISHVGDYSLCVAIAVSTIYALLAAFFWMNTIAFDVWRTLYLATKSLRLVTEYEKWHRYRRYSAYSWLSPLLIVVACLCFEYVPGDNLGLRPEFTTDLCWFNNKTSLMVFFILPFVALTAANVILFIYSTVILFSSSGNMANCNRSSSTRDYKLFLKLAIMTGLTWFTGILGFLLRNPIVWVIFILLNALQGFFIFISFTCTNKTVKNRIRAVCKHRFSKNSVSDASGVSTVMSMSTTTHRPSAQ